MHYIPENSIHPKSRGSQCSIHNTGVKWLLRKYMLNILIVL